jgi:hypothetical protein
MSWLAVGARRLPMRMIMHVDFPPEPFNALVRNGTVGAVLQQALNDLKPQAAYFSEENGRRGGVLIVDVPDASKIPALSEPFFLTFNANVRFRIAMTPEDLARADLEALGKKYP